MKRTRALVLGGVLCLLAFHATASAPSLPPGQECGIAFPIPEGMLPIARSDPGMLEFFAGMALPRTRLLDVFLHSEDLENLRQGLPSNGRGVVLVMMDGYTERRLMSLAEWDEWIPGIRHSIVAKQELDNRGAAETFNRLLQEHPAGLDWIGDVEMSPSTVLSVRDDVKAAFGHTFVVSFEMDVEGELVKGLTANHQDVALVQGRMIVLLTTIEMRNADDLEWLENTSGQLLDHLREYNAIECSSPPEVDPEIQSAP